MNILFFLTPKRDVDFIYDDFTLRQALEKMEQARYTALPILAVYAVCTFSDLFKAIIGGLLVRRGKWAKTLGDQPKTDNL